MTGLLADHPGVRRMTDVDGVGRATVVPYPCLIVYGVVDVAVMIQLVRHAARDPSPPGGD